MNTWGSMVMNEQIDGIDRWVDGQMDGSMDQCKDSYMYILAAYVLSHCG